MEAPAGLDLSDPNLLDELVDVLANENDPVRLQAYLAALEAEQRVWKPLPHQIPPEGNWYLWLLAGGRGAGKTRTAAQWAHEHVHGPPCDPRLPGGHRMAIVAPTTGDAAESCVNGPSGLRMLDPGLTMRAETGGTIIRWPNRAEAKLFGAHRTQDTDRLRAGGNRCSAWLEELAAWRQLDEGFSQVQFGLRIGKRPRMVASTTPKNRPKIRDIYSMCRTEPDRYKMTTAGTASNPYLPEDVRRSLYNEYKGTRLGQQELYGILLDDLGSKLSSGWFELIDNMPTDEGWRWVRYWDLAATPADEGSSEDRGHASAPGEDPDWTAGALMGWHEKRNLLCLANMVHVRRSPAGVKEKILETARIDGIGVEQWIEQDPGQAGVDQVAVYKQMLSGISRVHGNRPTGPKDVRSQRFEGMAEQRRVAVVRSTSWNRSFFDECEEWGSEDARHDDQIDAVSGATTILMNPPVRKNRLAGSKAR